MRVLLLGGTADARALAELLQGEGIDFLSTLAGRVARPRLPVGEVRIGGFGGVPGLQEFLAEEGIDAVVDATHPFAAGMSRNAVEACAAAQVPLLRLERPGWGAAPGADAWHWVEDHDEAATVAAGLGSRPFLTVGRQSLDRFTGPLATAYALVRVVDAPDVELPDTWTLLPSRGPYTLDSERALLRDHGADVLVTKDSGGTWTWPKMAAADELGVPIVVVRRASASADVSSVAEPGEVLPWLNQFSQLSRLAGGQ
ncbi:cobalt-precorrin-6A reductase [Nocardioides sp. AE5]|uniref:cobalt-precorrin-6A reductase n=1 Tax=Nocardioides sp. AE5 TaxID=2962573 RepID=UPI0028825A05|nr:cobalt-precorrin-6A reductase [Nocardioides sp. AE5]MDT0202205.1 cobalt-precorrin-6A reductase [Nocardioides sp. AE5]